MKAIFSILMVVLSFLKTDTIFTGLPEWELWGSKQFIHYDRSAHVWLNSNCQGEMWRWNTLDLELRKRLTAPERVPEKTKTVITFSPKLFWQRKDQTMNMQAAMACMTNKSNRRFKLINVEQSINEMAGDKMQFRIWPHLGLLYVGTVAHEEGWNVTLYDELVQDYVDLEKFIEPGDIVGFSMVATGMSRSVELARQAKRLGARLCIAGNDSAIFRADQLLRLLDHPIDAVFTSNSLTAVRQFMRQVDSVSLDDMNIPGMAVVPTGIVISNERTVVQATRAMRSQLERQGKFDSQDVFVVPKLDLYTDEYWQTVWNNYRLVLGHKHADPLRVRNGLSMFAQGCTRTGQADVCLYCTVAGVADIRLPTTEHLKKLLEAYQSFGIDYLQNVTDSVFEMTRVMNNLKSIGASFPEGLMIYGRAWGLAHHPELIDGWLSLTGGRLLINVGMDSGDAVMLERGVIKASQPGSRLAENHQAVENIRNSGAHLHYSLIFGSPGETKESCERTLEFFEWTRTVLGRQLDQCETDIFWLNHGSPASRVFYDYGYAVELAALAGKEISYETWKDRFHRHRDTLVVPWECEQAWYDCFTSISVEEAQAYNVHIAQIMARHDGAAPGRDFAFRPS
jgi:radical SAM superfamily enzyme YgiQ (UPF0313 family)